MASEEQANPPVPAAGVAASGELWFFDVPAPQSGHVVEYLKTSKLVEMAAAVYSGVDVVALVDGAAHEIDEAYKAVIDSDAPIERCERFIVDEIARGRAYGSNQVLLRGACTAFVRCAIRAPEVSVPFAVSVLARLPGVARLFSNVDRAEVVLEVLAADKRAFDDTVMATIQGQWSVVRSTRSFLVVSGMRWDCGEQDALSTVFVSAAASDVPFAVDLGERIETDIGLRCWIFRRIPIGVQSWTVTVDEAMASAPLHLFVISAAALSSAECQREFGRVEALAEPEDICCLVLPDVGFAELPMRYQQRQCLDSSNFFAYPQILEWMRMRLASS